MALGSKIILEQKDSTVPSAVVPGKLVFLTDSKTLWLDTEDGKRIQIGDILYRISLTEGDAFVAPLPKKFYHEGKRLWFTDVEAVPHQLSYQDELDRRVPSGTVLPFIDLMHSDRLNLGYPCPYGWLVCDGTTVYDPTQPAPDDSRYSMSFSGSPFLCYDGILDSHIPDIAADTTVRVYSAYIRLPNLSPSADDYYGLVDTEVFFKQTVRMAIDGVYPDSGFVPAEIAQTEKFRNPTEVLPNADLADDMTDSRITELNSLIANWRDKKLAAVLNSKGYEVPYYLQSTSSSYVKWQRCFSSSEHYDSTYLYTVPEETKVSENDELVQFYTNTGCSTAYEPGGGLACIREVFPPFDADGDNVSERGTVFVAAPDFRGRFPMGVYSQGDLGRVFDPTLPNIRGTMSNPFAVSTSSTSTSEAYNYRLRASADGPFRDIPGSALYYSRGSATTAGYSELEFDASKANPIYQDGATVRPPSFGVNWIIKV